MKIIFMRLFLAVIRLGLFGVFVTKVSSNALVFVIETNVSVYVARV